MLLFRLAAEAVLFFFLVSFSLSLSAFLLLPSCCCCFSTAYATLRFKGGLFVVVVVCFFWCVFCGGRGFTISVASCFSGVKVFIFKLLLLLFEC